MATECLAQSMRVSANDLHAFCMTALRKVGVTEADARTVADVLVATDTWGVSTHGVKNLRFYVRRLRGGGLRTDTKPEIVSQGPGWAMVDGHSTLGHVTSVFAMRTAMAKARECGIGYAGVRNSCHFGAAGYYASLAAQEDMIGIAMANDTPSVTAPGSRGPITGTNPLAYGVPTSTWPILLDMATSAAAGGKVAAAHALGKAVPAGWVVDKEGVPSTDPAAFLQGGALMPMGGHKGYGISLLIETLSALLTGAFITWKIPSWVHQDASIPTGHGAAFIAVNIGAMMPIASFKERVDGLVREIHSAPKARGSDRIFLPGEIEWQRRQQALAEGIVLPPDVVDSVAILSEELGLTMKGFSQP
jgi:ureidoglycolate dehydrogenase (NAD+)